MSARSPGSKSECHQKDIPGSPWGDQQLCETEFWGNVFGVYWKLNEVDQQFSGIGIRFFVLAAN